MFETVSLSLSLSAASYLMETSSFLDAGLLGASESDGVDLLCLSMQPVCLTFPFILSSL